MRCRPRTIRFVFVVVFAQQTNASLVACRSLVAHRSTHSQVAYDSSKMLLNLNVKKGLLKKEFVTVAIAEVALGELECPGLFIYLFIYLFFFS